MFKKIVYVFAILVTALYVMPVMAQDACEGQVGAAFGLCNAYCEAMDCDSADPQASDTACDNVMNRFEQLTGTLPPCEVTCPCWDANDLLSVTADNNLSVNSCSTSDIPLIQNNEDIPEVEGGFAAIVNGDESFCYTRDYDPLVMSIPALDAQWCVQQIASRCAAIGDPISAATASAVSGSAVNDLDPITIFD